MTQHDVRLALANTEAADIASGVCEDLQVHATITPSMMINMGMEHEQSQYVSILSFQSLTELMYLLGLACDVIERP